MLDESFDWNLPKKINEDFYIAPDTEIYVLEGVPLDNSYEHTIVWGDMDAERKTQRNYFLSKAKLGVKKQSYQRVDREWFKIYIDADAIYNCNYVMFRNTAFNPKKWWYGFILDVEYINNNTAKIRYEIDVMQTWLPGKGLDYELMPCFVERCHSFSDKLYENLIPESVVNNTDYLVDDIEEFDMNEMSVVILATEVYDGNNSAFGTPEFKPAEGFTQYGTYGAVDVQVWSMPSEEMVVSTILQEYIRGGKENSIIGLQMFPTKLLSPFSGDNYGNHENPKYSIRMEAPHKHQTLGGQNSKFIPKNAKLYSYPFNIVKVNNECGTVKVFAWELFDENYRGYFVITGTHLWSPSAVIVPKIYKGISLNMENAVCFNNFPVCPWSSDAYKAWWAQNSAQMGLTVAGGIASLAAAIAGAISGNAMLAGTGAGGVISSASKIANSLYDANHIPAAMHGDTNTSLVLPVLQNTKFVVTRESLRPEILQLYDDYFTKFGYAQKKIMTPPLRNRLHWTYVQTVGCEFEGTINDKDMKKIKSVFDNGVTFWMNPNEVGNYNLDNYPLGDYPVIIPNI